MRTQRAIDAIGFVLVTLGIAGAFLPAQGMTLNRCKRAHAGYCAYRLVGGERDWEPGLREQRGRLEHGAMKSIAVSGWWLLADAWYASSSLIVN